VKWKLTKLGRKCLKLAGGEMQVGEEVTFVFDEVIVDPTTEEPTNKRSVDNAKRKVRARRR
jgi:hypothetical protein